MTPPSADSTAFIDNAAINAGCAVGDGSFAAPALAANAYEVVPGGTPWQFAGAAGISANDSGFTPGNPNAPEGDQVAFIKDTGSMSQSVYLAGGIYNVSFLAAQRDKYQSQYRVARDPGRWPASRHGHAVRHHYGLYATSNFTVAAGMHTIEFVGVEPQGGDNTAFIDEVQLNV